MATPIATNSPVYASPDVETLRPNAAGTNTDWTPSAGANYACVNEETPDEDDSYVYTTANNRHDSYNLQDHTNGSGNISNVRVYARAKSLTAGRDIAIEIVVSATTYTGAKQTLTIGYVDYYEDWAQNPAGPADWTWSDIDALEAGVRNYVAGGVEHRVTTVWVEVTYTPDWQSYESDYTTVDDLYDTEGDIIYMKGTGFAAASYKVRYYDATPTQVGTDANITVLADGILQSNLACNTDPGAAEGTWNAKVYLSDGTTLIADDTFTVTLAAIPEFPTVMAAIGVAGLCFGIYFWMRQKYRRQQKTK